MLGKTNVFLINHCSLGVVNRFGKSINVTLNFFLLVLNKLIDKQWVISVSLRNTSIIVESELFYLEPSLNYFTSSAVQVIQFHLLHCFTDVFLFNELSCDQKSFTLMNKHAMPQEYSYSEECYIFCCTEY